MPCKTKKKQQLRRREEKEAGHANIIIYACPFFYSENEATNNSLSD